MADDWDKPLAEPNSRPDASGNWDSPLPEFFAKQPKSFRSPVPQATGKARLEMYPQAYIGAVQDTIGLPGTLEHLANKLLPDSMHHEPIFPTGDEIAANTGWGLRQREDLTPEGGEKYAVAGVRAIPAAVTTMLTSGLGPVMAGATALGGEELATAAHDLDPESAILPIVGGIVGSLGTGWATSGVLRGLKNSAARKEYAAASKALQDLDEQIHQSKNPELVQKSDYYLALEERVKNARNALFDIKYPGTAAPITSADRALDAANEAKFVGRMENSRIADNAKFAARQQLDASKKLAEDAMEASGKQTGAIYEAAANGMGKAKTLDEAGSIMQKAARNWVDKVMPKKLADAKAPLEAAVPGHTPVETNNYQAALRELNPDGGALQGQMDILSSGLPKALQKNMEGAQELAALTGQYTAPTWKDVAALRSRLGDAMANPSLMKGMDQKQINYLYKALTEDLSAAAKEAGAGDLWTHFNDTATKLYSIRDGVMSKLVSTVNKDKEIKITPAQAAGAIIAAGRKGGTELALLREEMPEALNELSAHQLRDPKAWTKLSPEAKVAFLPEETKRTALDTASAAYDSAKIATKKEIKQATKDYNDLVTAANNSAKEGNFNLLKEVRAKQKAVETERRIQAKVDAARDRGAADELRQAEEELKQEKELLAEEQRQRNWENTDVMRKARKRKNEAEAALPARDPNLLERLSKNQNAIMAGAGIASAVLPSLGNSFYQPNFMTSAMIGALAAPPLWNAAKQAIKNPRLLAVPAFGAAAGANQNALTDQK